MRGAKVAHYVDADLVDGPGGGWNVVVFVGDPDGDGCILREHLACDQDIERRIRHGR